MAFENAYLTEEEKQMFKGAGLTDPRGGLFRGEPFVPTAWTIDRENNIALICGGIADREEYKKETFALFYKSFDEEHMAKFTLIMGNSCDEAKWEHLKKDSNVNKIVVWRVDNYKMPCCLSKEQYDKIFNLLAEALSTYGISGNPKYKYSIKAVLRKEEVNYFGN